MKDFLTKNKTIIVILSGILIISTTIYLSTKKETEITKTIKAITRTETKKIDNNSLKNCQNIEELPDNSLKLITKIIDGDTFLIEGGYPVRILGIDADERDHPCYEAAKNRLEELILNKEVRLEKGIEDKDQYCRYLRYVFLDNDNISLRMVKEGLAVARFSPEDKKYRDEIINTEKEARENKIGCKWSPISILEQKEGKTEKAIEERKTIRWEKLTPELTNLKVIDACQAGNYLGKEVIVEGKIASAYRSKTNTVFLNFEKPYPNQCFTAVIFSSDQYKFIDSLEKYYANKTVRIKGIIKEYKQKPEIILKNPLQIEIGDKNL